MRIVPDTADAGRALHARLLADDPTASYDIANAYLVRLADWLRVSNPRVDPDICDMAAGDALVDLIKNPASYRPERQTLEVYLRMSASGDLKNLLRAERRHSRRRADLQAVELSPLAGKYLQDAEADPARIMERREAEEYLAGSAPPIPAAVRERLTPEEAEIMRLMRAGERRTIVYAAVLGLAGRPVAEQRREVKRAKDRLKKRLERAGGGDG
jgi:RNA polymerase sigma-70 factor, ECF subfamily